MAALVRSLFVWLMVLAIPNQGFAASAAPHCAPAAGHAGDVAAMAADGHDHVHAAQGPGRPAGHATDGSVHQRADGSNSSQDTAAEGAGTCSVCAACCHAIGMPPSVAVIAQAPDSTQSPRLPAAGVESFVPGGLDRPPRSLLA